MTLTTDEAARLTGRTPQCIRMWVMRGKLEPVRRGAKPLLFREDDVLDADEKATSKAERRRLDTLASAWLDTAAADL